ncbi:hypothetical protein GF359_04230 [candidate division WOR-3 bacterium]|uniref:Uncharacterized protein n=1 Tax=candidate division WOR-3 bacterium TaxID=2052148 RepID=A0A9D5QCW0_UNCW3|nr:hypothetical protein [candidate division WOR-3 bacterium]MBD3364406.1 hypothetical protein [candidate division WOR-3 bacterium]
MDTFLNIVDPEVCEIMETGDGGRCYDHELLDEGLYRKAADFSEEKPEFLSCFGLLPQR